VGVTTTSVRLLKAAAEIVGGTDALAGRLGVTPVRLAMMLEDRIMLPDPLLLRAVDIILEERQVRAAPRISSRS